MEDDANPDNSFVPEFRDEATGRGLLNEGGFGWGAAIGDLNLDGWLDVVQANGMADDSMDRRFPKPRNYWYAAEKVMLAPPLSTPTLIAGRTFEAMRFSAGRRTASIFHAEMKPACNTWTWPRRLVLPNWGTLVVSLSDFNNEGVLDMAITHQFGRLMLYHNTTQADFNRSILREHHVLTA